jgi:hypothetical protein
VDAPHRAAEHSWHAISHRVGRADVIDALGISVPGIVMWLIGIFALSAGLVIVGTLGAVVVPGLVLVLRARSLFVASATHVGLLGAFGRGRFLRWDRCAEALHLGRGDAGPAALLLVDAEGERLARVDLGAIPPTMTREALDAIAVPMRDASAAEVEYDVRRRRERADRFRWAALLGLLVGLSVGAVLGASPEVGVVVVLGCMEVLGLVRSFERHPATSFSTAPERFALSRAHLAPRLRTPPP